MNRRTVLLGMVSTVAGVSGLLGYRIGKLGHATDHRAFLANNPNVKFQHLSADMLMKLFTHNVTSTDRAQLQIQLLRHNLHLFAPTSIGRVHGSPGFYSIQDRDNNDTG